MERGRHDKHQGQTGCRFADESHGSFAFLPCANQQCKHRTRQLPSAMSSGCDALALFNIQPAKCSVETFGSNGIVLVLVLVLVLESREKPRTRTRTRTRTRFCRAFGHGFYKAP